MKEAEAYGILLALKWVSDLGFDSVIFETDAKTVSDAIHANVVDR